MEHFADRTAVITGAASGIGRGLAERAATEGMRLVLADVEPAPLSAVATALASAGADVLALATDVSDGAAVEALAAAAVERCGSIDLVCLNAGVFQAGELWERSEDDLAWVLGVNLWGVLHGIRAFVPRMLGQGTDGHVVVTSSVSGLFATGLAGPYIVSKFAAYGAAENLAHDLASTPIGVSVLCPGAVRTGIADSSRNRPASAGPPSTGFVDDVLRDVTDRGLDPSVIAELVFAAARARRFLVLTDDEYGQALVERAETLRGGELPAAPPFR